MANRNKKNFTLKKSSKIALLACAIYLIGMTVFYSCMYNALIPLGKIALPIVFTVFTVLVYLFVYEIYSCNSKSGREEIKNEISSELKKFLSQEYKEVGLIFPDKLTFNTMLKQILKNEEIKFFAKFAPNNNIIVIAKDKNDKEVYKKEIENLEYFKYHFKVN